MKSDVTWVLAALVLTGCRPPTSAPTSEAEAMYLRKCGVCHEAFPPTTFAPSQWTAAVGRMQEQAHLTDEETKTILAWLRASSERTTVTR